MLNFNNAQTGFHKTTQLTINISTTFPSMMHNILIGIQIKRSLECMKALIIYHSKLTKCITVLNDLVDIVKVQRKCEFPLKNSRLSNPTNT